ncbi:helix-turn-helix transcriptional regulator [Anoxybacterium hadale]|uniref:Helix-turn-helix transcriptional regulator n=1 Tax=Anoxybacterium hadale TaxID=3408580 RepID=A0ACD1ACJ9_9FIRM|nr:helix-turn-helix transcriptional regulator [Clostridiales bacterium]
MNSEKDSRLRQIRKELGLTVEEFAKQFLIASKTQTSYENGSRIIPVDYAIKVCTQYNITLDWFYGRSEYKNDSDLMVNIIFALDKIFSLGYKTTTNPYNNYKYRELTLWMDKTFREYLAEIRELQDARNLNRQITDELYSLSRSKIQEKYKEYFQELLGVTNCEVNESKFINIETIEDMDILKFL